MKGDRGVRQSLRLLVETIDPKWVLVLVANPTLDVRLHLLPSIPGVGAEYPGGRCE